MKRVSGRFMILILLSVALMLSGCASNAQAFTVTYDLGYDDKLETEYVYEYESLLEEPERPYREGYSFLGWWYLKDGNETEWDFENNNITEDMTLYAKWEEWKRTSTEVTLDPNGGVCEYESLTFYLNDDYKLPIPQKDGYYFGGWYINGKIKEFSEGTWLWSRESMVLTARWLTFPRDMTVKIGRFEQDGNTANGAEEIEWYVVDYKDGKYLLFSKYLLHEMVCVEKNPFKEVTYKDYPVRQWLIEEFYEASFSEEEKAFIEETYLSETLPSEKVFLFNKKEMEEVVFEYDKRMGIPSAYIYKNTKRMEFNTHKGVKTAWYCLRDGRKADADAFDKGVVFAAVRPSMWIDESYVEAHNLNSD